ncbi:MAG: LysM domain-containing protein [Pseudomonadota bacterium]
MIRNRFRLPLPPLLAAVLLLAGCGGGDRAPSGEETNDSEYQRGLWLEKQDRPKEALAAYLKVIARRGEENAPESHLEAGVIIMQQIKDPIQAIYHFQRYLDSQPAPPKTKADLVRQQIDAAKRDFARSLRPQPLETTGDRQQLQDQVARLQRENDDLKAELAARSGGEPAGVAAPGRPRPTPAPAPVPNDSPITLAPMGAAPGLGISPVQAAPVKSGPRAPASPPAAPPAPERKYTVQAGDTLFKIAQREYGASGVSARAQAIYEANRDVMKSNADLKPGMELRLP